MTHNPESEPIRDRLLFPQDIVTPAEYFRYAKQRLGEDITDMPTVRVPHATLMDVMRLVIGLLDHDPVAYEDLQIFEIESGDCVFTSHIETPDAGDRAAAFFQANASTYDQRAFAKAFANTVVKLHRIHEQWTAAGQQIRPTSRG